MCFQQNGSFGKGEEAKARVTGEGSPGEDSVAVQVAHLPQSRTWWPGKRRGGQAEERPGGFGERGQEGSTLEFGAQG